jgi:ketosteroid isomerase-like protein
MKNFLGAVVLVCACTAMALAQTGMPTANGPSVSQTIRQLEHDWVDAEKAGDAKRLNEIIADDWVGIFYDGSKYTKQDVFAELKSGKSKLESLEFGPMEVKVLGDVAVVQGSDSEKSMAKGKDTSGRWVWMDVFVKRNGKWMAVRSQSAKIT